MPLCNPQEDTVRENGVRGLVCEALYVERCFRFLFLEPMGSYEALEDF